MVDCLYQFAKDFQTLIVGVLGFSGVIFTLRVNSRLSRDQHERNITHEREVLKAALRAELELIHHAFTDKSISLEGDHENIGAFFPEETHTKIYNKCIEKLGLLSPEQVSAVIEAYTVIDEVPTRLRLLTSEHDSFLNNPGYIFIERKYDETATGIYKAFLPTIEKALNLLASK